MRVQTETRSLPTELSPEDLAAESQKLAAAVETVKDEESRIAVAAAKWKETKKDMEGCLSFAKRNMHELAEIVESGKADREVECSWLYALKQGYGFLVRDDTGELVHHRKLGDQERQTELLEVLREPTEEQLATWIAELGLVIDPQGDLPLAEPAPPPLDVDWPDSYYRDFVLPGEHGQERITARFSEADHRPSSLTGVYVHGETEDALDTPDQADLDYEDAGYILRNYRQALEDLLEAKKAEAQKSRGEFDESPAPTPSGRGRKK